MTITATTAARVEPVSTRRPPLSRAERQGLTVALAGVILVGGHGFRSGAHSTVGYLASVLLAGAALFALRTQPIRPGLARALGALAVGHLAGGLVRVGGDVLYNAQPHVELLQYDHVFHATASAVATLLLLDWIRQGGLRGGLAIAFAALGALGLGGLNELVEFGATLAHQGDAVGGYRNTGWDLVSDAVGIGVALFAADAVLSGRTRRAGPAARPS